MNRSIIQVYTGDGKGKTTAAIGLAARAAGNDMNVLIIQFMKADPTGERISLKNIDDVKIENYGFSDFLKKGKIKEKDILEVKEGFKRAIRAMEQENWDILILDEINVVLDLELLELDNFIDFLRRYGEKKVEIILTGRNAPQEIIELASLVTEMKCIKHPYEEGLQARKGIEY